MINCLLLDDDPAVLLYMRNFIEQTPFLNLVAVHQTPAEALQTIENKHIQLIITDIGLPGISGIEFSRILIKNKPAPLIILISAFERFALDGYKVDAVDYLLKPIEYDDFLQVAYKVKSLLEEQAYTDKDYLFLRVEYELVKVYLKEALYFEGFKDYVKVFLKDKPGFIKCLTTLKSVEKKLPPGSFIRIHRSFIVSTDKIERITRNTVHLNGTSIPVSDPYREIFKQFTDRWFQ